MVNRQEPIANWKRFGVIVTGVLLVSIGLEMFLMPHRILPGGIKGVAIILAHLTEMKMGLYLLFMNLPFVLLRKGRPMQTVTAIATLLLISFLAMYLHPFPPLFQDPLLCSLFGGAAFGIGIGLIVRYGWYSDAVNAVAFFLKKRLLRLSIAEIVMLLNIGILAAGGFFFGWDQAVLSIIAYFVAYRSIQFTLDYRSDKMIWISSMKSRELSERLNREFDSRIQFMERKTSYIYGGQEIFCLLSWKDVARFKEIVKDMDPAADIVVSYAAATHSEPYYRM
jgi:uncharacterized membrane-anchored protein YitT (DUF2179 family)